MSYVSLVLLLFGYLSSCALVLMSYVSLVLSLVLLLFGFLCSWSCPHVISVYYPLASFVILSSSPLIIWSPCSLVRELTFCCPSSFLSYSSLAWGPFWVQCCTCSLVLVFSCSLVCVFSCSLVHRFSSPLVLLFILVISTRPLHGTRFGCKVARRRLWLTKNP